MHQAVRDHLAAQGRKGGKSRMGQLTKAERQALARKAAAAAWTPEARRRRQAKAYADALAHGAPAPSEDEAAE